MKLIKTVVFSIHLIIIAAIIACATSPIMPEEKVYDIVFKPYVDEFSYLSNVPERKLREIKYVLYPFLSNNAAGVCEIIKKTGQRTIKISLDAMFWSTELQRKAIMFHEIGHCYCGRLHVKSYGSYWSMIGLKGSRNVGQCPMSLMYPTVISDNCLQENWEEYLSELTSVCPSLDSSLLY